MLKKPFRVSESVSPFRAADFVGDLVLIKLDLVPKVMTLIRIFCCSTQYFLIVYHADSRVTPICFERCFTLSTFYPNVTAAQ